MSKPGRLARAVLDYLDACKVGGTDSIIWSGQELEQRLFELFISNRFMTVTQARELALQVQQALGESEE